MTMQLDSADFYKWFMSLPEDKAKQHISILQQLRVIGKDSVLAQQMQEYFNEESVPADELISDSNDSVIVSELEKHLPTDEKTYELIDEITPVIESLPKDLICFKDTSFSFMNCNHSFVDFGKFGSKSDIVGKTDFEMPWEDQTTFYRKLDRGTLAGKSFLTLMPLQITTGEKIVVLQDKRPLRDNAGVIRGTAINMTRLESPNILKPFITFAERDLITPDLGDYVSDKYLIRRTYSDKFTEMESVCLFYYIRGRTAKEIARILGNSPKTVESYLERIRMKINCSTRSEVLGKVISFGFLHIIPEVVLSRHLQMFMAE